MKGGFHMLFCDYCKRKVDERCDLCIYKKEAKEVNEDGRKEQNNGNDKAAAGPAVCVSGNQKCILPD